jgi:chitinase
LIEDNGLDGLDIDFEYPTAENSQAFGSLLQELRTAFDQHAESKGDTVPYQITAAISAGPTNYENYDMAAMTKYLSYWDLMAYDYAGSWSPVSADHANLYHGVTGINTNAAIDWFLSNGVSPSKMTVGIPLYGRSFESTKGIYKSFEGVGATGIYNYNQLPHAGATVTENKTSVAAYSYNHATQELVSFDTPNTATWKAQYVNSKALGGAMFWELSGDGTGSKSIVTAVGKTLGDLDQTHNHIHYPGSQFVNIQNNMGNGAASSSGSISISSVGSTGGVTTKTCGGVAAWSKTAIYVGGKEASYKNEKWQAKWWTQGDVPGSEADVWVKKGKC